MATSILPYSHRNVNAEGDFRERHRLALWTVPGSAGLAGDLGPMQHAFTGVAEALRMEITGAARDALPRVGQRLWAALAAGTITEAEAGDLDHLLAGRTAPAAHGAQRVGQPTLRVPRPARPRPAESLQRRRRWAAAGYLPPKLAASFTTGEQAVMGVIAETVTKRGSCDLCHGQVAALAGVSTSTVKRAIRAARLLGLVAVRERRVSRFRSDSNVLTIVSTAWCAWLQLGPKNGRGGGVQSRTGTNTDSSRRQPPAGRILHANGIRASGADPARSGEIGRWAGAPS